MEYGIFGGVPLDGLRICSAHNPDCIIGHINALDIHGSNINAAVLGAAAGSRSNSASRLS